VRRSEFGATSSTRIGFILRKYPKSGTAA
jgi:hypothetical protein